MTPDIDETIQVNDLDIHYEYFGDRSRQTMVIFNGVAMQTKSWYKLLPVALPQVDVLLWDFRGQGKSTSDDSPYRIEDLSDCIMAIIDKLRLEAEQVNFVGVSTGGVVAAETLRKYHERVNCAVFSGVIFERAMSFNFDSEYGVRLLREGRMDLWADAFCAKILSDKFLTRNSKMVPEMRAALFDHYQDRPYALARIIEAQATYLWDIEKYYEDFKKVETPLLILAGAEDRITPPSYQKRILDIFPDVEYEEYADCGHIPYIEKPARAFADTISFFTEEIE